MEDFIEFSRTGFLFIMIYVSKPISAAFRTAKETKYLQVGGIILKFMDLEKFSLQ